MKIPLDAIIIPPDRQRQDHDQAHIDKLAWSIREYGLLQPIVVEPIENDRYLLVAGECRTKAYRQLGRFEIEASTLGQLNDYQRTVLEYEENARRKQLSPEEDCLAKDRIHQMYVATYGEGYKIGEDRTKEPEGWTQEKTAEMLGEDKSTLSIDLKIAKEIKAGRIDTKKFTSKKAMYKAITQRDDRAIDEILARVEAQSREDKGDDRINIICGDSIEVLKDVATESIDLIITDPPYGVDFDTAYRQERSWGDQTFSDIPSEVLNDFSYVAKEMYRVLKSGGHIYVFFPIANYAAFKDELEEAKFLVRPVPLIWTKEGRGSAPLARNDYTYAMFYEPIFYATKNDGRPLNFPHRANVISDSPPDNVKIHPAQKPVKLLTWLMENSSLKDELVLDPYGGSGSIAIAAHQLGRRAMVIECDSIMVMKAKARLKEEER